MWSLEDVAFPGGAWGRDEVTLGPHPRTSHVPATTLTDSWRSPNEIQKMSGGNRSLLLPLMLITVGAGWLLSALNVVPSIDWIWTLGLAFW